MKKQLILFLGLIILSASFTSYAFSSDLFKNAEEKELKQCYEENTYNIIVKFNDKFLATSNDKKSKTTKVLTFLKKNLTQTKSVNLEFAKNHPAFLNNVFSVNVNENKPNKLQKIIDKLNKLPEIEFAQINNCYFSESQNSSAIPADPLYSEQYYHQNINSENGWAITTGDPAVTIAVLDVYGVQADHEDLADNMWVNEDEIANDGLDNDGNGYIDDIHGWDFWMNGNGENSPWYTSYHATTVAGIAAATTNNNLGVAGVCQQCKILTLRMRNTIQTVPALLYALNNGAQIINMSFGSYNVDDPILSATFDYLYKNNIVLIASAGNMATDAYHYPSGHPHVLSVAATNINNNWADFSNYGLDIDLAAPGEDIFSTFIYEGDKGQNYAYMDGTSVATPIVSGTAGLLLSKSPNLLAEDLYSILKYSVQKIASDKSIGTGLLDIGSALQSSVIDLYPFAIIEQPWNGDVLKFNEDIGLYGTALGFDYQIDYRLASDAGQNWQTLISTSGQILEGLIYTIPAETFEPNNNYIIRLTVYYQNSDDEIITDMHEVKIYVEN